jgi:hypothetical protein
VTNIRKTGAGTVGLALLIAILVQIPFAVLFVVPRTVFGVPGLGALFFLPAFALVRLISHGTSDSLIAIVVLQTLLTFVPVFWILTWRRHSALGTLARVAGFIALVVAATALTIPMAKRLEARHTASGVNSKSPILPSIQRVNGSLKFFEKRYGTYPGSLEQLDFPPDQDPVDSRHAGLIQFPLPMQDFFDFSYARRGTGYELCVDGKPGQGWDLYHYCSDESGTIRFDTSRNGCNQGAVVYARQK